MGKKEYKFTVVIERDEDGRYVVTCPTLQGCYSDGATYEEAMANIKDAIDLAIASRLNVGDPIPEEVGTTEVRIAI